VQITHDKLPKQFFVNDGARIYYAAGNMDQNVRMFQVNANGGEPVPMPRLTGMVPLDISPDRSELLLAQFVNADAKGHYPIWVADTLGSAPRRIGDVMADYARWSPYGDEILYCDGPELRIARADGSESRRLAALNGILQEPAWSPDGRLIRFTLLAKNSTALWEVAPDGSRLHALLPELSDHPHDGGAWTPDGNYFVFSLEGNTLDLWALRESRRFFRRGSSRPLRLTTGPLRADLPEASSEGHRFFFRGEMDRDGPGRAGPLRQQVG
jgi:Tol biopolymer transport system component